MAKAELKKCQCGGTPKFRCERAGEDAEDCWVECPKCGRRTEYLEDAYADFASAALDWNTGDIRPKAA